MPDHQYSLTLIAHHVKNSVIQQRSTDGYINATQLCQVAGKQWHNYIRNETTGHFLRALEAKTRIRVLDLYQQVTDKSGLKSTWVHPKVAIHLAQWLSADFAVQVSEWVYDWIEGKGSPQSAKLMRLGKNISSVLASSFGLCRRVENAIPCSLIAGRKLLQSAGLFSRTSFGRDMPAIYESANGFRTN